MSFNNFATRMTCFSLVSAIESDIRNILIQIDRIDKINIPSDVRKNAEERYESHFKKKFSDEQGLEDLIEFSDFSDLSKLLAKSKNTQTIISQEQLKDISQNLEKLTSSRNRICHSRPLESNDTSELIDFSIYLKKLGKSIWWPNINEALNNLNNPAFALSLQIPEYWKKTEKYIHNNLPLPEFDDTGFLGRSKERRALKELIFSHTKVISLIGEGGIGKTALAVRCLYDVLEVLETSETPQFDMIIWTTLKANKLTPSGVLDIRDSITSSIGLYEEIGSNIGADTNQDISKVLSEISLYMKEFKILLCIDNLETLDKQEVREFLATVPNESKVLITSRIGLGEIEYRYKLDSLDEKASISLIRNLSVLLNIESLIKKKTDALKNIARRLYNNPLLIKWFVLGIGAGSESETLLSKNNLPYRDALKFCFQNLYERLTEIELDIIKSIACIRNSVSPVELKFILDKYDDLSISEALHNLNNSSMLKSTLDSKSDSNEIRKYTLTNIASDFINSIISIEDDFYERVKLKIRELRKNIEENLEAKKHYSLDPKHIHTTNDDERICAVYLKRALESFKKRGDIETATELVSQAKSMMPNFSECYRISAFINSKSPFKAQNDYETALEYNPESIITLYTFAQFLTNEEDFEAAEKIISKAIKLDPIENTLKSYKALILTRSGDYPEAIRLYEEILPAQSKNTHRKFRISTFQQIITCYIRYSERLIVDIDYNESSKKINRAIELLYEAVNSGNFDEKVSNLILRIMNSADKVDSHNGDVQTCTELIKFIENSIDKFSQRIKSALSYGIRNPNNALLSLSSERLLLLSENIQSTCDTPETEKFGTLKNTVCKTASNVSYGFISGDDNNEYFFHRGELNPNNMLDGITNFSEQRLSFTSATSDKGETAQNVRKI